MKIAINALPISPGMTGIGTYTQALVNSTINFGKGHTYFYITNSKRGQLPINNRNDLGQFIVNSPDPFWEQLHLPTEMAFWQVSLYHSPLFTCPIIDELASVITIHDVIPETRPDLCSNSFLEFYRSKIGPSLRACIRVITTSEFSKQEIIKHLHVEPDKIEVIYQGISPDFSPKNITRIYELREKFRLPEKYILFVGMIEPRKNVERLILAFSRIAKEISDLSLVIAGRTDNPDYSLNPVIEQSGVCEHILILGYINEQDLQVLYSGAQVFVFPSLYEGFGRPVVEAMASGVPVVISKGSSLPEIAEDASILVDPEDTSGIAEAILQIYRDKNFKAKLIELGIKRAGDFTYQKFGERLVTFYDKMQTLLPGHK